MMNRVELEGVLAHELSHIKNYDILVTTSRLPRSVRSHCSPTSACGSRSGEVSAMIA